MKLNKKIFISTGALISVAAPVSAIVSCNEDKVAKITLQEAKLIGAGVVATLGGSLAPTGEKTIVHQFYGDMNMPNTSFRVTINKVKYEVDVKNPMTSASAQMTSPSDQDKDYSIWKITEDADGKETKTIVSPSELTFTFTSIPNGAYVLSGKIIDSNIMNDSAKFGSLLNEILVNGGVTIKAKDDDVKKGISEETKNIIMRVLKPYTDKYKKMFDSATLSKSGNVFKITSFKLKDTTK